MKPANTEISTALQLHPHYPNPYPNPFNAGTVIPIEVPANAGTIDVAVYN